ncbi:hypothetical protein V5799_014543 [Amblyomma americanum]|uniref:Uncharacterized protein n=1 Tax=Amblyomma americanum TaxID=6943 RepID=A0AAQ4E2Q7_AMBAM
MVQAWLQLIPRSQCFLGKIPKSSCTSPPTAVGASLRPHRAAPSHPNRLVSVNTSATIAGAALLRRKSWWHTFTPTLAPTGLHSSRRLDSV